MEKEIAAPGGGKSNPNVYPWLVFVDKKKRDNQVCWDLFSETPTCFTRSIPGAFMDSKTMLTNHLEWLFLPYKTCLWNPVTLQSIDLPPLCSDYCDIRHALLTKSPTDPDCVLLLWGFQSTVKYCRVNEKYDRHWDVTGFSEIFDGLESPEDEFCDPVTHGENNEILHSTFESGAVSRINITHVSEPSIRLERSRLGCKVPIYPYQGNIGYNKYHWVAYNNDVFLIRTRFRESEEIIDILVFNLDFSDMTWNIVDSCPNAAFFISHHEAGFPGRGQAYSCPMPPADSSRIGNRVYFTRYGYDKDESQNYLSLHTYHIQQKTLSISLLVIPPTISQDSYCNNYCYWALSPIALESAVNDVTWRSGFPAILMEASRFPLQVVTDNEFTIRPTDCRRSTSYQLQVDDSEFTRPKLMLDSLPIHILTVISSHLTSLADYVNFRAVFPCVGSVKDYWRKTLAHKSSSRPPWLMIPSLVKRGVYRMVDPVTSKSTNLVTTPETWEQDSRVFCSSDGWLLVSNMYPSGQILKLHLYNPLTKSTINLPDSRNMDHFFFNSHVCQVVGISGDCFIQLKYNDQMNWDEWGISSFPTRDKHIDHTDAVLMNGCYYFLLRGGGLAVVGPMNSSQVCMLRTLELKLPFNDNSVEHKFLVECGGDLLTVYVGNQWKWLRVFKFNNGSEMVWEEVKDLKNNNLYLSHASSIFTKAESPQAGNRIYFPRFYQDSIVYFSLNTQNFHSNDGHVMSSFYGSQQQLYGCWFHPNLDRFSGDRLC